MTPQKWFFVVDPDGLEYAAFPERDLAEAYVEDMPWEIEERTITTDSTFVSATLYDETLHRAEKAEAENKSLNAANASLRGAHECDLDRIGNIGAALRKREADNAALRERIGKAEIVLEKWRILCEMGLQDVCSEFVRPSIEQLWELTDEIVPCEKTKARAAIAAGEEGK